VGDFKKGDIVFYHDVPGVIRTTEIEDILRDSWALLKDVDDFVEVGDLFHSEEAARAALSPAGKRMQGCIEQAESIYETHCHRWYSHNHQMILDIAFQLFNTEGE